MTSGRSTTGGSCRCGHVHQTTSSLVAVLRQGGLEALLADLDRAAAALGERRVGRARGRGHGRGRSVQRDGRTGRVEGQLGHDLVQEALGAPDAVIGGHDRHTRARAIGDGAHGGGRERPPRGARRPQEPGEHTARGLPALLQHRFASGDVDRATRLLERGERRLGGLEREIEPGVQIGRCADGLEMVVNDGLVVDDERPSAREALPQAPAGVDRRLDADDHGRTGHRGGPLERGADLDPGHEVGHGDVAAGSELRAGVVGDEHDVAPAAREPQRTQVRVQRVPDRPVDEDVAAVGHRRRLREPGRVGERQRGDVTAIALGAEAPDEAVDGRSGLHEQRCLRADPGREPLPARVAGGHRGEGEEVAGHGDDRVLERTTAGIRRESVRAEHVAVGNRRVAALGDGGEQVRSVRRQWLGGPQQPVRPVRPNLRLIRPVGHAVSVGGPPPGAAPDLAGTVLAMASLRGQGAVRLADGGSPAPAWAGLLCGALAEVAGATGRVRRPIALVASPLAADPGGEAGGDVVAVLESVEPALAAGDGGSAARLRLARWVASGARLTAPTPPAARALEDALELARGAVLDVPLPHPAASALPAAAPASPPPFLLAVRPPYDVLLPAVRALWALTGDRPYTSIAASDAKPYVDPGGLTQLHGLMGGKDVGAVEDWRDALYTSAVIAWFPAELDAGHELREALATGRPVVVPHSPVVRAHLRACGAPAYTFAGLHDVIGLAAALRAALTDGAARGVGDCARRAVLAEPWEPSAAAHRRRARSAAGAIRARAAGARRAPRDRAGRRAGQRRRRRAPSHRDGPGSLRAPLPPRCPPRLRGRPGRQLQPSAAARARGRGDGHGSAPRGRGGARARRDRGRRRRLADLGADRGAVRRPPTPIVATIHDLAPVRFDVIGGTDPATAERIARGWVASAAAVTCSSNFIRADIEDLIPEAAGRLTVMPLAAPRADSAPSQEQIAAVRRALRAAGEVHPQPRSPRAPQELRGARLGARPHAR